MKSPDALFARLSALPVEMPSQQWAAQLGKRARERLLPRRVHPAVYIAVAASIVTYLAWALAYTGQLG